MQDRRWHTDRMDGRLGTSVLLDRPTDLRRSIGHLRRGPGDPSHRLVGDDVWRTTLVASGPATVRLRQVAPDRLDAVAWGPGAEESLAGLPRWFADAPFDLPDAAHQHVADAHRRRPGLRTPATGRLMEALVPAILEQKVLGVDAFAAWRRLLQRFGSAAPGPTPVPMRVVPSNEQWAAIASWDWHAANVDPQRYRTVQAAARVGERLETVAARGDLAATYRALRSIPGVGAWTAAEVGIRTLGDPDAVSWGDYHLADLVGTALTGVRATDAEVPELLEPYRPHRGHVVRLLQMSPLVRTERRGPRNARVDHRHR